MQARLSGSYNKYDIADRPVRTIAEYEIHQSGTDDR